MKAFGVQLCTFQEPSLYLGNLEGEQLQAGEGEAQRCSTKLVSDWTPPWECPVLPYQGWRIRLISKKNTDLVLNKDWLVSKHFMVTGRGRPFFQLGETCISHETSRWV